MGRTSIYMVMGLTLIMLFFGKSMTDVATEALTNSVVYYENTQRYNYAVAGANLACNQIFMDNTWRDGFTNMEFNGGIVNVSCFDSASGTVVVTSTGRFSYESTENKVVVLLSPSSFSKFAMYCGNVSAAAKLRDGDTVNGAVHYNNKLSTQGGPVFLGRATMGSLQTTSGTPKFLGGFEEGVNIPFPDYSANARRIDSLSGVGGHFQNGGELWLKFLPGGNLQYKTSSAAAWSASQTIASFAPNGKIAIRDGALHVEGTLQGQVTIASTVSSSTTPSATQGATYIEDDLRYQTDPITNPSSTDMLGIVSAGNLQFEEIPMRVDGNLFTDQNATLNSAYNNINPMKQLKIVGTFIARNMNSTDFGTGANKGANFYMKYDSRIEDNPPDDFPFPLTTSFEILSWFE